MAQVLGESGRYVADQAQRKRWQMLRTLFILTATTFAVEGFIFASFIPGPPLPFWAKLTIIAALPVAFGASMHTLTRRLRQLDKERDAYNRGADGEDTVARALAAFPEEFFVINDLATPFGNLDHVVVGPTGVFILDTKAWRGVVTPDGKGDLLLNGHPTDKPNIRPFIARMLGIRDRVRTLAPALDPYYQPVFVFTSARVEAKWGTTGNLHCIRDEQLHDYIVEKKVGQRLRAEDARTVAQAFLGLAHMERDFTVRFSAQKPLQPPVREPVAGTEVRPPAAQAHPPTPELACVTCGQPVSRAEQLYCRGRSQKLGGRILCRACQQPFLAAR